LTEKLKKKAINLGQEKIKTKKLTTIKKVAALLVEQLRNDLATSQQNHKKAQTEIKELKTEKQDLAEQLERKQEVEKELYAKIRKLKNSQKEQEQELTTSKTTIQELEKAKTN